MTCACFLGAKRSRLLQTNVRNIEGGRILKTEELVDHVFDSLILRKLYHIFGGLLIVASLILVRNGTLLFLLGSLYLIAFGLWGKRVSFAILAGLLLAIVTSSRFACAGAYTVWAIGDGVAAIAGTRYGRTAWPWHQSKTPIGTLFFFLSAFPALAVFVHLATISSGTEKLWLALVPAAAGALTECLPVETIRGRKPDDNLLGILSSGLLLHALAKALSVDAVI